MATKLIPLALTLCLMTANVAGQIRFPQMSPLQGYVEPFQMFDNLYYVGDKWVSAYVLSTSEGLVLIDTLDLPYSKWLPKNLQKLGLNIQDIKHILITHPHSDHVAGAGYLQQLTGAKVIMLAAGETLLAQQSEKHGFVAPTIDLSPTDGQVLSFGHSKVRVHHTPGHTPGCMSLDFNVIDNAIEYRAFVVCGNGTNFDGQAQARAYMGSAFKIEKLANTPPLVEVNLASHPHLANLFNKAKQRQDQPTSNSVNPFVDRQSMLDLISLLKRRGDKKLKQYEVETKTAHSNE